MNDVVPSIGVAVFKNDSVLLVWKKNSTQKVFQLPGGQIEPGETLEEAALRELYETTGLKGNPSSLTVLLDEWHARIEKRYGTRTFSLRCVVCGSYEGEINETESAKPIWVKHSELGNYNLVQNTMAAIRAAKEL